jgi:hypothetical protein
MQNPITTGSTKKCCDEGFVAGQLRIPPNGRKPSKATKETLTYVRYYNLQSYFTPRDLQLSPVDVDVFMSSMELLW